ncbi:unnamed protein product [Acanthoscelides obtectus]|uniref:Uncharacterized protein n=1 Tax=Acanthoscelides obtectus TaxID=200917 RepID=A0A9P0PMQ9_ACAOB|nr:unnamed protein product [Acanthoscelides obtectus]CAK1638970.1 hypothetical protein AOBTE_LOCUS10909 [Acanthoscelides obtectus]
MAPHSVASLEKKELYKILYKETVYEVFPFDVINLLQHRKGAPKNFKNITFYNLYLQLHSFFKDASSEDIGPLPANEEEEEKD